MVFLPNLHFSDGYKAHSRSFQQSGSDFQAYWYCRDEMRQPYFSQRSNRRWNWIFFHTSVFEVCVLSGEEVESPFQSVIRELRTERTSLNEHTVTALLVNWTQTSCFTSINTFTLSIELDVMDQRSLTVSSCNEPISFIQSWSSVHDLVASGAVDADCNPSASPSSP